VLFRSIHAMTRAFRYTRFFKSAILKGEIINEEKEIDGEAEIRIVLDVREVLYVYDVFRR